MRSAYLRDPAGNLIELTGALPKENWTEDLREAAEKYLQEKKMNKYGLYGKLQAKNGQGAALGQILLEAAALMQNAKGCILYVVSVEAEQPDNIWVTEIWDSKEDHDSSLYLPGVRELIAKAMPLLGEPPSRGTTLEVLGGVGIR
jgi:quinol monooxygenase YgiN